MSVIAKISKLNEILPDSAITTSSSLPFRNCEGFDRLIVYLNVTIVTGTLPTYNLIIEAQDAQLAVNPEFEIERFPTIIGIGQFLLRVDVKGVDYFRLRQIVAGTTPSFTRDIHWVLE